MNERIKQFIKQMDQSGLPSGGGSMTLYDTDLEYFAELIIQECLNICEEMGDNGKDGHYCADEIARTFLR